MDLYGQVAEGILDSLKESSTFQCGLLPRSSACAFDGLDFGPSPFHRDVLVAWTEFPNGLGATVYYQGADEYEVLIVDEHGAPVCESRGGKFWRGASRDEVTDALREIAAMPDHHHH